MEAYYSAEQFIPETFMIPGIGSNSYLTSTPPLEEIKYMGSEGAPEFVFDQGVYYPAAGNYYGYYCTGFESPGEWDDHRRFFGVDGQDLHYSDLQSQSLPYAYYTPSYGYAESPYNPYNPYIPVIGHDGSFVGTQPYLSNPSYQHPVSSPTYFPVVTPSSSDILPVSSSDPSLLGTGVSVVNRPNTAGISYGPSLAPANAAVTSQRVASGNSILEPSQSSAHQIQSTVKVVPVNQPLSRGGVTPGSISQVTQGTKHFSPGQKSLNVTVPGGNGFTSFGSHVRGWASFDKFRPRFQYNGALNDVIGSLDVLGEQNRGPRTNRSKGSWMAAIEVRAYTTRAGAVDAKGNIIIHADEYNRDDFQVDYPDAKFFVIKSYSEDDVHKSIKYNVWSSTPNGNKRLDSAYEEAQRISVRKQRKCPVFLFFSVNASGQFCGVAEMIGPVDFNKDMDFWQQDKWTGSFPIKWHIVKDVPNASFRHIILENNENKPVTNSRDTQEIAYLPGMNMLSIFKNSPLRTSILDDFMYYEERQKIMYEEKCKLLGRNNDTSVTLPASSQGPISSGEDLPNSGAAAVDGSLEQSPNANKEQSNATLDQLPKKPVIADQHVRDDGKQLNVKVDQADKADEGHANGIADQPSNSDGRRLDVKANPPSNDDVKQPVEAVKKPLVVDAKEGNELSKADRKQQEGLVDHRTKIGGSLTKPSDPKTSVKVGSSEKQVSQALDATNSCSVGKDARPDPVDVNGVRSIIKIASLSIDSKIPEVNCTVSEVGEDTSADVVTVGSMHIKVKKSGESSGILTVGSILIDPKR